MSAREIMRDQLRLRPDDVAAVSDFLASPDNRLTNGLFDLIDKYGGVDEINRRATEAGSLETRLERLHDEDSPFLDDLEWLTEQRDAGAFVSLPEYRHDLLGDAADTMAFNEANAVTLEISALQYFPWLITEARQSIERQELMPGRYIRVRKMKEQERDQGDLLAVAAAMQIVGATYAETLDTKGTDGSNIHLGGPDTITGYFGGVGQPNQHALQWIDEFLYYYTRYGIRQVLNINPGTVLLGYLLHRLGVDIEFKISVFMGNDNPYSVLWTLMTARLFSRKDGSTPLIGFNLSNSVDRRTLEKTAEIRKNLGLEDNVRIEHHITETWKSIVRQPYNRRQDLLEVALKTPNISAKHEGGDPEVDQTRQHPSDILDYFREKEEILSSGDMANLERNYMDKHDAVNKTACALTERGLSFIAAWNLHRE